MRTPESKGYAKVNGAELYYEVHGDGPPLMMLHGGHSFGDVRCAAGGNGQDAQSLRDTYPGPRFEQG